jgi:hypothetical protein
MATSSCQDALMVTPAGTSFENWFSIGVPFIKIKHWYF